MSLAASTNGHRVTNLVNLPSKIFNQMRLWSLSLLLRLATIWNRLNQGTKPRQLGVKTGRKVDEILGKSVSREGRAWDFK